MTNDNALRILAAARGKRTEWKVRMASFATFLGALAGGTLLDTVGHELVAKLPDWLQVSGSAVLLAAITWTAGRAAATKPDYLSPSTVAAVQQWLRRHAPHV